MRESDIQSTIQIALSQAGFYNLRVNSGQAWGGEVLSHDGTMLLLKHPTKIMLAPPGTSDIIGCVPVVITPDMVGKTIAQMACIEVKRPGEKPEKHQERFLALMRSRGCRAGVARSPEEALAICQT